MPHLKVALLATLTLILPACGLPSPAPASPPGPPSLQPEPSASPTSACKNPVPSQPWVCLEDTRTPLPPGVPSTTPSPSPTPHPEPWDTLFFQASGPAICPQIYPGVEPILSDPPPLDEVSRCYFDPGPSVLDLLNRGASHSTVRLALDAAFPYASTKHASSQSDLTGDDVPEVTLSLSDLSIFGCQSGQYVMLANSPLPDVVNSCHPPTIDHVADMNLNGRPDILIHSFSVPWHYWQIIEWQGTSFRSLLAPVDPDEYWPDKAYARKATADVRDTDGDGTYELLITGGFTDDPERVPETDLPYPQTIQVYAWDGFTYSLRSLEYISP